MDMAFRSSLGTRLTTSVSASRVITFLLVLSIAHAQRQGPAIPESAADNVPGAIIPSPRRTLLEAIRSSPDHKVFVRLLPWGDVDRDLGAVRERRTVFAPTDAAFAALVRILSGTSVLPSNTDLIIRRLRTSVSALSLPDGLQPNDLVRYHVLEGARPFSELEASGNVNTLAGVTLGFANGVIIIDQDPAANVTVLTKDILHLNGWLNVVPGVLLPFPVFSNTEGGSDDVGDDDGGDAEDNGDVPPTPETDDVDDDDDEAAEAEASPSAEAQDGSDSGDGNGDGGDDDDDDDDDDDGVCFPGSSQVRLADGRDIHMRDLTPGTLIAHALPHLSSTLHSSSKSSPVFLFSHRSPMSRARFLRISTSCHHTVTLTPSHYLLSPHKSLISARSLRPGHTLATLSGPCTVTAIRRITAVGLYSPHPRDCHTLIVDGVFVSTHTTALHPRIATALLAPLRFLARRSPLVEPLGPTLYQGADWAQRFLPRGPAVYSH